MFLEYVKLLKIGTQPEFSFDYIFPTSLILLSGVVVIFIGYKIKEELGAIIALLICVLAIWYLMI